MRADGQEHVFADRTNYERFHPEQPSSVDWCSIDAHYSPAVNGQPGDSTWSMVRRVEIHSQFRPLRVGITYQSASPFSVGSPWSQGGDFRKRESDRRKVFSWFYYPDTSLVVPLTFALVDSQQIQETIEVVYDTLAYPLQLSRDLTNFSARTIVSERHTFGVLSDSTDSQHN
jgi:hypothetical protein